VGDFVYSRAKRSFNAEAWRACGQTERQRAKSKRSETLTNEGENEVCLAECKYFDQGAKRMVRGIAIGMRRSTVIHGSHTTRNVGARVPVRIPHRFDPRYPKGHGRG